MARQDGDEWQTLLGCGRMWAAETVYDGDPVTITCHAETPPSDGDADDASEEAPADDDSNDGLLGGLGR